MRFCCAGYAIGQVVLIRPAFIELPGAASCFGTLLYLAQNASISFLLWGFRLGCALLCLVWFCRFGCCCPPLLSALGIRPYFGFFFCFFPGQGERSASCRLRAPVCSPLVHTRPVRLVVVDVKSSFNSKGKYV
eukprot:6463083-Amphidinium_carterae.1